MARRAVHRLGLLGLLGLCLLGQCWLIEPAVAKRIGFSSPNGRHLYSPGETLADVVDERRRRFAIEMVTGLAPEGNLGINLGWRITGWGLGLYTGLGAQTNPSYQVGTSVRYEPDYGGYRPYVGLGYVRQFHTALGTRNDNGFAELGWRFRIRGSNFVSLGAGARYIVRISVASGSPLNTSAVDRAFLQQELNAVPRWVPIAALRFSKPF